MSNLYWQQKLENGAATRRISVEEFIEVSDYAKFMKRKMEED